MDKNNRFTFTADEQTLNDLLTIKKESFYDKSWSEACLHIIKLGIKQAKKRGN